MFQFKKGTPESVGIDSNAIKRVVERLYKKQVPMHSLLIARGDTLVFEGYYNPCKATELHRMFSISKSFTALAVFLLFQEGKIDLEAPICQYFPEYVTEDTHPWIRQMTLRNCLEMRTCHANATYNVHMKTSWVESFFNTPPTHKAGTIFHYDTSAAHVMAALVEKLTGGKMLDYLKENVLKYLDFSENSYMLTDPFGISMGGSGLMATPLDILKVLYLLDNNGVIKDSEGKEMRLLPEKEIRLAVSNISDTIMTAPVPSEAKGYGMQIWQNEAGGFVLYGMGGQLAIQIPTNSELGNLLVMTTADTQGMAGGNQLIYDALYEELLPALSDSTLKPCSSGFSYPELKLYAPGEKYDPGIAAFVTDASETQKQKNVNTEMVFDLAENDAGFEKLAVRIGGDGRSGKLNFIGKEKSQEIPFGFGSLVKGEFTEHNTPFFAGAKWLREEVLYVRVHLVGECVGSLQFELYFGKENKDITVFMKKIEETWFQEFNGHLYGRAV